jgi:serine/threonine protein kinase
MAEVYLASAIGAEGFSRKVAIKRVLPGFSDNDAFAKMFVDEAQISSQLVHPNIVSVLDFDRDPEQRLFLVMELVEGRDLAALVDTGLLPIPVVIYVLGEVLRGLGYAHDLPVGTHVRGVVHRDVSPHNVLLSWEGAVKVSDFGIAKARAASEATASVFIKGKPASWPAARLARNASKVSNVTIVRIVQAFVQFIFAALATRGTMPTCARRFSRLRNFAPFAAAAARMYRSLISSPTPPRTLRKPTRNSAS